MLLLAAALLIALSAPVPASGAGPDASKAAKAGCKKAKKSRRRAKRKHCAKAKKKAPSPLSPAAPAAPAVTAPTSGAVAVRAAPSLTPAFDPAVSDYTVPCDGTPVWMTVSAPPGASVSVDGKPGSSGDFSTPVSLQSNQEFDFAVAAPDYSGTYHVRCLPQGFPEFTYERFQQPNNPFYLIDPNLSFSAPAGRWVVLFDDDGVPIWWAHPDIAPMDSKVLADGRIAWTSWDGSGYTIHDLDGSVVQTLSAVGGTTDTHDLQELPNGDFLLLQYRTRDHVDLTSLGGPADATVQDGVIERLDSAGQYLGEWNSKDHIGLADSARWCCATQSAPYDIVHVNAVEPDGNDLLVSFRHTDGVYKIDGSTGNVVWKLGGTPTAQSLTVLNDPYGSNPLGGQHDPRLQPDGTITIHDNGTNLGRAPRAVRYSINETAKTATLVESVTDPDVTSSVCCGSARRSASGAWLMSWGGNPVVTEFAANGSRNFRMTFANGVFSYRAFPVPSGVLTANALRAGMDAQYPRP